MTLKPIIDKAEVSVDLSDRYYRSSFERDAAFEVRTDEDELILKLVYKGDGARVAGLHLHYYLLADILEETARSVAAQPPIDDSHREALVAATRDLLVACKGDGGLVLGASNAVQPEVPIANYWAMIEAWQDYGRYSGPASA